VALEAGTPVEFRIRGERRLAVVEGAAGKKHWTVRDRQGRAHTLHPRQVEYEAGTTLEGVQALSRFLEAVEPYLGTVDSSDLELAWELLLEQGETATPAGLAQVLFSESTPEACYAAYCLLEQDRIYFKRKGDTYEPRPSEQVADLQHQLEAERQREREWQHFAEQLQQAEAGQSVEWSASDCERLVALEQLVLYPERDVPLAQQALAHAGRSQTPQAAFRLLVDIGWWHPHENLALRRSSYPINFPQQVRDLAQQYQHSPPRADGNRLDLSHLKLYTIDDASTAEIDDGLSVETLGDGTQRLWIHIADPSYWVAPADALDLEARRRSTSLYLPTGTIPMFPPELATGAMSLVQGQICPALSFGVVLSESGAIGDYTIRDSWVRPTYRLTYDDADEMLQLGVQAEPELLALADWAQRRAQWRQAQGAIDIRLPEAEIAVGPDSEIDIQLIESSPARQLVAEMMILTGEVAGHHGQAQQLPLPFRSQPQPELPSDETLLQLPAGPVRACALRGCMPRSETSIQPARHAGLGLPAYTQVTSPIRRYADLLAHFQLKAHLRGEALPFSSEDLQELTYSTAAAAAEASSVERQTKRYWRLEYLRRHGDRSWSALVLRWLRPEDNLALVMLEDIAMELPHRFQIPVALGDRVELQVVTADPHNDVIRLRERANREAQPAAAG